MAAEILRIWVKQGQAGDLAVDSFGTNPYYPDNPEVKGLRESAITEVMGDLDNLQDHVPKGIGDIGLVGEDLLVLLAPKDLPALKEQINASGRRPRVIIWDIEDPFRKPLSKYIESAKSIKALIEEDFIRKSDSSGQTRIDRIWRNACRADSDNHSRDQQVGRNQRTLGDDKAQGLHA